jgi:hypothetical protein
MKKMTTSDRVVFKDALDYCLCHNSDAVLLRAVLIGDLEVSLWIFQADDGADEGIAVKLRSRGVLGRPEEPWRESDMKAIADGLAWAMSEVTERSTRRRWSPPRFL